jgi:hypothetical protein
MPTTGVFPVLLRKIGVRTQFLQYLGRTKVFAGGVAVHNGTHDVLRHRIVVGQQLFGVLGQAVAAITKAGVVVVVANARVQAHAVDDLPCVEPVAGGIGVQLVEIGHTHGQVGVGKQFDGLGLGAAAQQHVTFCLMAPCCSSAAKVLARSLCSPTTMRLGCRLSNSALPSRKNSGLKMMFWLPVCSLSLAV